MAAGRRFRLGAPGVEDVDAGVPDRGVRKARIYVHRHRLVIDIRGELLRVADDDPPLRQQRGDQEFLEWRLGGFIDDEHVEVGAGVAARLDVRMLKDPDGGPAHEIGGI